MAEIISVSLTKEDVEKLNYIQDSLNFSGKSEIVREGLKALIEENTSLASMKGEIEGTIIVTHKEKYTKDFSEIKHSFHNLVKTHIHHELKNHVCMEILLFSGDAKEVKKLHDEFLSSKKIDSVKLVSS